MNVTCYVFLRSVYKSSANSTALDISLPPISFFFWLTVRTWMVLSPGCFQEFTLTLKTQRLGFECVCCIENVFHSLFFNSKCVWRGKVFLGSWTAYTQNARRWASLVFPILSLCACCDPEQKHVYLVKWKLDKWMTGWIDTAIISTDHNENIVFYIILQLQLILGGWNDTRFTQS